MKTVLVPTTIAMVMGLSFLPLTRVKAQELTLLAPTSATASQADAANYILGSGDRLSLTFFNVPEYNGEQQVLVDGSVNLPLIGKLPIAGLTLEGATQVIANAYAPYLNTPLVTVNLVAPRPIRIGISGAVSRPGAYEIQLVDRNMQGVIDWPTVIEAITLSGGITNQADVRQISIRRPQPSGGEQVIQIDLWDMLLTGNIQSDITLRHGDAIQIPKAVAPTPEELTQLAAANFSPDNIRVTVTGEVITPSTVEIPPNAPLNQALLAAGGFDPGRADTDEVKLIRLNPDGTVSQRVIPVAFDQGINEETNPSLRNNDVVLVGRSGNAKFSDSVGGVFGPLSGILSPFRLLFDIFDSF